MEQSSAKPIDQDRVQALMLQIEQLTLSRPNLALVLAAIHQKLVTSLTEGMPESGYTAPRKLEFILIGHEISADGFPCVSVRWPETEQDSPYIQTLMAALDSQGMVLNQLHVPRAIGVMIALSAQN